MQVAVVGLGYVGLVSGVCFAGKGHRVVGFDIQTKKIDLINATQAPVFEPGLQSLLQSVISVGAFSVTSDIAHAVADAGCILICVGTPASWDGSADLSQLMSAVEAVGEHLYAAANYPVIAIRSTVPPGTLIVCVQLLERISGRIAGQDFAVVSNPEFLREGSALADFYNPGQIQIGTDDEQAIETMRQLYADINAPIRKRPSASVEMLKYATNAWHATKVAFANEMGTIGKACGVDGQEVMRMLCEDERLNISNAYLTPGFAYGGSCLGKDLQALAYVAKQNGLDTPLLAQVAASNEAHIEYSVRLIEKTNSRKVGFLGLTFKEGTDDLRESPAVVVLETLLDKGYEIRAFDPNIATNIETISGAADSLEWTPLLLNSVEEVLAFGETIVVTRADEQFNDLLSRIDERHILVDMTRLPGSGMSAGHYNGICW